LGFSEVVTSGAVVVESKLIGAGRSRGEERDIGIVARNRGLLGVVKVTIRLVSANGHFASGSGKCCQRKLAEDKG
jgi:hypothetical protein